MDMRPVFCGLTLCTAGGALGGGGGGGARTALLSSFFFWAATKLWIKSMFRAI